MSDRGAEAVRGMCMRRSAVGTVKCVNPAPPQEWRVACWDHIFIIVAGNITPSARFSEPDQ